MSINFITKNEDGFLKIIAQGSCENLNQLKEYVLAIYNATITSGQTRVFVDETRLVYRLSILESYYSGCFISQLTPKPQRIAVLCKADGWGEARFWETVAVNRGVPVKIFQDLLSAEDWILT